MQSFSGLTQLMIFRAFASMLPPRQELDTWLCGYKRAEKLSNGGCDCDACARSAGMPRGDFLKIATC
jgi:hypothetical protein